MALTNRVLAADRVAPGDDDAVAATLQRLAATLDLAIERLAPGDDERGAAALRTIPLVRLFRAGVTMIGKVRRLALALLRGGPFGRQGLALAEPEDATVLEALTRARPLYPRILDQPPARGRAPVPEPGRSRARRGRRRTRGGRAGDAARPGRRAAATSRPTRRCSPTAARTPPRSTPACSRAPCSSSGCCPVGKAPAIAALDPRDVRAFESQLRRGLSGPAPLPAALAKRARALLDAAAPVGARRAAAAGRRAMDRRPGAARAGAGAQAGAAEARRAQRRRGQAEAQGEAESEGPAEAEGQSKPKAKSEDEAESEGEGQVESKVPAPCDGPPAPCPRRRRR